MTPTEVKLAQAVVSEPRPPTAAIEPAPPRRPICIAPGLVSRLTGPTYDGADVANALHDAGFDVIPLGGIALVTRSFDTPEELETYFAGNIENIGGAKLGAEAVDGVLRATFTAPTGADGRDTSKIPVVKRWNDLPFDEDWWVSGAQVELPAGWTSFGTRRSGEPILERRGDHRRNVGIRTGKGLLVVDVDRKQGRDGLRELEKKFGDRMPMLFPPTLSVATPTGGLHWYYSYPLGLDMPCSASRLAPGVDVRADGGMAVAPGSVRLNGRRYEVTDARPIAELSAEALGILQAGRGLRPSNVVPLRPSATRAEALERVLAKFPEVAPGTRHATLASVAGVLRNLLTDDTDLEAAYREFARLRGIDGREPEDLEQILEDAKAKFTRSRLAPGAAPSTKATIVVRTDQAAVVRELEAVIATCSSVYARAGELVTVIDEPGARPVIHALARESLGPSTTDVVDWIKLEVDAEGNEHAKPVNPPGWAIAGLVSSRHLWPNVRRLDAVAEHPVLRPDGTVFTQPGYDAQLRLFLGASAGGVVVPESPTQADAQAAAARLVDLVCDFPFAGTCGPSVFLAAMLTPLCRHAFDGYSPIFLVDKSTRGSGGTLFADIVWTVLRGAKLPRTPHAATDEEMRKQITSVLLSGAGAVLLDNVAHPLGGAALDMLVTASEWTDRKLTTNDMVVLKNKAVIYATGNNVEVRGDTHRRVLRVRLESALENPEEREGFKHPQLLSHVLANRAALLGDALTIVRAYCAAGRPAQQVETWGSFEEWSGLVASAVVFAGLEDPTRARGSKDDAADAEKGSLAELFEAIEAFDERRNGVTAAAIAKAVAEDHDGRRYPRLGDHFRHRNGRAMTAHEVGTRLKKSCGRVVGGQRLARQATRTKSMLWWVEAVTTARDAARQPLEPAPAGGDSPSPQQCDATPREAEPPPEPAHADDLPRAIAEYDALL